MAPPHRTQGSIRLRKSSVASENFIELNKAAVSKRKASSPAKNDKFKRPVLGDIFHPNQVKVVNAGDKRASQKLSVTRASALLKKPDLKTNSITKSTAVIAAKVDDAKKKKTTAVVRKSMVQQQNTRPSIGPSIASRVMTRRSTMAAQKATVKVTRVPASTLKPLVEDEKTETQSSSDSSARRSEDGSLYVSALEDITINTVEESKREIKIPELSEFDKELLHDPHQVSLYAMDIFEYLKSRESNFEVDDYMYRQFNITRKMRSVLIDWMVEVHESFELFHETLYLSIKIVDAYLSKVRIVKDRLQLVGAAAMLLSCKYDERQCPLAEDFVYIGDSAYDTSDLLAMEQNMLAKLNFELSFPISYSFLRRYARCAKIQMPLLTLARYILELAQMDYGTVTLSDSKQAAAALYLAFRMNTDGGWTKTLEYYTGYKLEDFMNIVLLFNNILHQEPDESLSTIRNKYSHEVFFEVTKIPLVSDDDLRITSKS